MARLCEFCDYPCGMTAIPVKGDDTMGDPSYVQPMTIHPVTIAPSTVVLDKPSAAEELAVFNTPVTPTALGGWAHLYNELRPKGAAAKLVSRLAMVLMFVAVVHIGVFIVDDRAWAGAVSWRKPIVFAVSFAMLAWAVGWVLDRLPERRGAKIISRIVVFTSVVEISLISMQAWRGRASHFNDATNADATIFGIMGQAVLLLSIAIFALLIWSIIERPCDPVVAIAAIAGLVIMMTGLGIGVWLVDLGKTYYEQFNEVPAVVTYGEAGVPKFPHGVAFHGIHVFAVAAALLTASSASMIKKVSLMLVIVVSYTGVLGFSALQTFEGRAPTDVVATSAALATVSTVALGVTMAASAALAFASNRTAAKG